MPETLIGAALLLLLTMTAGLARVLIGPTAADRMMGVQLLGTTGIAILLLLGFSFEMSSLADVALVFALLASVSVTAFTRRRVGQDRG